MSKSEGYKKIEALLAGGAAQKQSSPSANHAAASAATATPAATPQRSTGYSAIEAQLAAGAQSLGKGNGYMLVPNWDEWSDYSNELRTQLKAAQPQVKPEDLTWYQRTMDKILGVDRTQVTGEKTDWKKLFQGTLYKGMDQYSSGMVGGLNWLFGDAAEQVHTLGVQTINDIISGLNYIPGVDIKPIDGGKNFLQRWKDTLDEETQRNQAYFQGNANSSRASQIVDQFGTSFVAAVPMALEALALGPAKAAQSATTEGLTYFSGLQGAKGMEAVGMMARQGHKMLLEDPQFWSSYLQAAGDSYDSAKEEGMNDVDAGLYTMLNAYFNAMIEIGGADEALGGIQNLPMRAQNAIRNGDKFGLLDWFKDSVLGEGMEEVWQGIAERGFKAPATGAPVASLDPNDTRAIFNPYTSAQEFTGGAVVGGLLGGGETGLTAAFNRGVAGIQEQARTSRKQREAADRMTETEEETDEELDRPSVFTGPEYDSIEDFSREFANPEGVAEVFNSEEGGDVNAFARGFRSAYDMGQSGVGEQNATEESAPGLSEAQRTAAFQMGRSDAAARAAQQAQKVQAQQKSGNLTRKKGTVKGEGVSMQDLRKTFNDSQNTAYRVLSKYAEISGVNIVLYRSQADENGEFASEQGRFQWKDDTIYLDLNAGLSNAKDAGEAGRYTMLRVFGHEFTHFVEKWNAEQYNTFREYVFRAMEARGENVNDLIESLQAQDQSGQMSYEQASREVVAESMVDVLQDSTLVQQLAEENPTVFHQLLKKLRQFAARIKQAYREMTNQTTREARALQEDGKYLDGIVKMWDEIAKGAVQNYQGARGETVTDTNVGSTAETKAEQVTGKKEKAASPKASKQVEASAEASEASKKAEPETRRVGMDFFKPVEETGEEAPKLAGMAAKRNRPASRDRFPANDFTSQAEAGPDLKGMVPLAESAPQAAQEEADDFSDINPEEVRAELEKRGIVGGQVVDREKNRQSPFIQQVMRDTGTAEDTPEVAQLWDSLRASNTATINGFRYSVQLSPGSGNYFGRIERIRNSGGAYPVGNARDSIYASGGFAERSEAVNDLVSVAERNNLLAGKAPASKGAADAFTKGDIFNKDAVKKITESKPAQDIVQKMPVKEEVSNGESEREAPELRAETGDRRDGSGTVRVPAEREAGRVPGETEGREPAAVSAEDGRGTGRDGDRPDAERNGRGRRERSGESGVQRGSDGIKSVVIDLTPQEQQREETHEAVQHDVEEKSTVQAGGSNFQIGESLDLPSGKKARYKANVDAIRLVKQLEAEKRTATPEEQAILSKYVGWGGIPEAFDGKKSEWSKEYAELKEVLTEDEYSAARGSTLNAHYTSIPVIRAMYRGLQKLGFTGGRMLEPSSGVGNFVGAMPADMSAGVKSWTMVELDNITGLIAKHLYPQADVRIEGFEKALIPDNFMDVAIGNVPFGNYGVTDRGYPKKLTSAIHNYFFAKSLDKVRPGGLVMFITSSYTMNSNDASIRRYMAKKADLLGAIRLPNNAFSGNAGTEVVTDILILKKRAPGTPYAGVSFENADYTWNLATYQNEYFTAHPEMVLGEQVKDRNGMYGRDSYTVNPFTDRGSLAEQIDKAFANIEGKMDYPAKQTPEKTNYAVERADKKTKQGGFLSRDGKIYQNDNGQLRPVETDEKTAKRITGMLEIRDFARDLLNAQMQGQSEKSITEARKKLNKAYDAFVKENGFLNSPANRKAFFDDPDKYSLFALENWDSEKKTATKADIFKENTVRPNRSVTHVDSVEEGVIVSRNTTGGIDVPLIARLTGRSAEDVSQELIASELAFKDRDGNLLPAEQYLSGNVRAKLREAQGLVGLDKDYQHNVDALKQIVPADIPHEAIFVQPGAPWIPDTVYSDFAAYILGGSNQRSYGGPDIYIHRSNETGNFSIDLKNQRLKQNYLNNQKWGTPARSFLNLLDAMLNSRSVTVSRKGEDGKNYVDDVATDAAKAKVEEIKAEFQRWLWEDGERTKDLEYLYNETFNALVTPSYDGSRLTVNGLRAGWSLKPHQANAVQRVISSGGNTLLAHRVGAGKTMEMAAAAMKLKELGIVKKPMFAVPKSLVAQWGKEFMSYFPTAKLLVAEQGDFTPGNRRTFANRIATGNYDAVIVSYEQFEKLPMSDEFTEKMYREQIDEIIAAIEEAKEAAGQKSMSVKDLEKKRKQLQTKIDKLTDKAKDTDSIQFEQLGIDGIFVDEAHNFKNLFYTTSMNNVAGLGNKDGSKRAFDLYTKVRYLQQLNGGRGVVFATATPIMNSMSEMYIMQKYLQQDLLNQLGLSTFDAWAKQFGEVVNAAEIKPSGQGVRVKQKFSRFRNLGELQLMFRNFADVVTKIPDLKIPKMRGGEVKIVESEPSEFQQEYMKELQKRADNIKNVDPSVDNMLKITSDGRKISYTQRMIDPSLPYEEGCKIYKCADNVVEEYKASKKIKGTQIIFLDMATPKGRSNNEKAAAEEETLDGESARLYDDLKARLVKKGIPAKEIAFIHDADTDAKKSKLFDDVNEGKVRVLIGSTGKMGVGMNAQKRIVAIHHLDAPWRPGDVEQRDGRAFRQKNMNEEVAKYVYVTKGSFDARLWDILGFKQNFIDQIMNGENVGREVEDTGEVTLSASEIKALASGNPLIKEQVELDVDIKRLENLYLAHNAAKVEARSKLAKAKQQRAETEKRMENARKDLKNRGSGYEDEGFIMTVGSRKITDKKAAGEALMNATAKANKDGYTKIGSFAGFDILAIETNEGFKGLLKGAQGYSFNFYPEQTTRMITRLQGIVKDLSSYIEQQENSLRETEKEIRGQEALLQQPFAQQQELDEKRARYNEIMDELNPKEEQAISEGEGDEDRVEFSLRRDQNGRKFVEVDVDQERFDGLSPNDALAEARKVIRERFVGKVIGNVNRAFINRQTANEFRHSANRRTSDEQKLAKSRVSPELDNLLDAGFNFRTAEDGRDGHRHETLVGDYKYFDAIFKIGEQEYQATIVIEPNSKGDRLKDVTKIRNTTGRITALAGNTPRTVSPNGASDTSIRTESENVNPEDEFSTRRNELSNREVLSMAAAEIDPATLSETERNALDVFQIRLNRLEEAQEQRAELGRQYRDQQFTRGGSRAEAEKTRNRMKVYDERIQRLQNELLSLENKDVLRNVLIQARGIVEAEERRRGNETLQRYRARRNESEAVRKYRARVRTEAEALRKWLVNPSNKDIRKHVPAEIQKTVADFLDSINLMSKTALATSGMETTKADDKYLKNMKKLHDTIKENVDTQGLYSGYADLPADFLDNFQAMIRKAEQHIDEQPGVFVVNQMSARELKELSQTLRTLKKYITTMNMLHQNAMFAHVDEAGESTTQHLSKFKKSRKSGFAYNFMRFAYMRPSYAFEHFGKGGQSIEHEFREGQATQAFLAKKIIDFAEKTYTGKEVKAWGEQIKTFELSGGESISLPVTHLMSLYCLNKRAQAQTHIYGDGIRVANYKANGKVELDEGHLVSADDVQKMIQSLTPRQMEVADALQKYMSTECAEWGNYVSLRRFDVEQFGEKNYFPINSDGRYLPATADESPDNAGLYALLNMGFTKELKENAKNRIILYNVFDVFANHAASMTQYRSFALPVLDALKWFNYRNESTSVRDQLSKAFGAPEETRAGSGSKGYAESFVLNLIRAYNGTAAQGDPYDAAGMQGLHRFNRAQIAFNLRVVVQQPTAVTRAAMLLSPRKILKGLGMSAVQMNRLAEEMEQHSGIAAWKSLGFYDTNISRGLTELIKQNPTFGDRVTEIGTKGAELADRYTWAAMWYAAKDSVKRSAYESEEAYMKAVTEKFEDVIYKTQVVDSVLTKSEFLRAKGFFPRMMGSFMSEPMTTVSMLADAHYKYTDDMQQGMSRSEAWKRNGKNIGKTMIVYAVGQVILSAAQAFMDAWRDDDEYDAENWFSNYFQKWLNAFKNNVIEEELPFGKIPVVSELYESLKSLLDYAGVFDKLGLDLYGNDISNGWAQYAKYLTKASQIIIDKLQGNKTNYTWYGAIYNMLRGAAGLSGYPAATAWREVQDIWNNTVGYFAPSLKWKTYQRAIDRTYNEQIRPTGLAQKTFEKILADADAHGDGNGSLKQDELGEELKAALDRGDLTREQADAVWASRGWKADHDFGWWLGEEKKTEPAEVSTEKTPATASATKTMTTTKTTAPVKTTTTAKPTEATPKQVETAAPSGKVDSWESFKKQAPVYHDKLETAYSLWQSTVEPLGIDLDTYTGYLKASDADGNSSVKQDELGAVLYGAIQRGELNMGQAGAIWRTLWNGDKSKTFEKWLNG